MSKDLLIDASHPEETRIAIKSDHGIEEYEYENIHRKNLKGNIYLGKVSRCLFLDSGLSIDGSICNATIR